MFLRMRGLDPQHPGSLALCPASPPAFPAAVAIYAITVVCGSAEYFDPTGRITYHPGSIGSGRVLRGSLAHSSQLVSQDVNRIGAVAGRPRGRLSAMAANHPSITYPRLHQRAAPFADKRINNGRWSGYGPLVHSDSPSKETAQAGATSPPQGGDVALVGPSEHGMGPDAIERHCELSPLPDVHAPLVHREYTCLKPATGMTFIRLPRREEWQLNIK